MSRGLSLPGAAERYDVALQSRVAQLIEQRAALEPALKLRTITLTWPAIVPCFVDCKRHVWRFLGQATETSGVLLHVKSDPTDRYYVQGIILTGLEPAGFAEIWIHFTPETERHAQHSAFPHDLERWLGFASRNALATIETGVFESLTADATCLRDRICIYCQEPLASSSGRPHRHFCNRKCSKRGYSVRRDRLRAQQRREGIRC